MPFQSSVATPGGASYTTPAVDFGILGNLFSTYQQSQANDQLKQLRELELKKERDALAAQQQLRTVFAGGVPRDSSGNIDFNKAVDALARAGDINALSQLYPAIQGQQAGQVSPLLSGGPAPNQPVGPTGNVPPASATAGTRTAPQAQPAGEAGTGTVMDIVASRYGDTSANTGTVSGNIARAIGVDPNSSLSPGKARQAQGLLARYSDEGVYSRTGGASGAPAPGAVAPEAPLPRPNPLRVAQGDTTVATDAPVSFAQRFGATSESVVPPPAGSSSVPTAAPVVSPAQPSGPSPAPARPAPTAGEAGGRITPQVPLPRGYNDPQAAILALRAEAARLAANPRAAGQVKALDDWAARIEGSLAPVTVAPGQRIVSPSGQTLYAAPERPVSVGGNLVRPDTGEIVYRGASPLSGQAIDDAARVYVDTGKFPPNMGRGVQGEATRNAILERASGMESELGLDPKERSQRWQNYATHAAGIRVLEARAANMTLVEQETKTLIPRVRALVPTVSRTDYSDLNKLLLAAQRRTGGENVVKLGIAIQSLIPVYARLLKPTGQLAVADMENARHILDEAWSKGQINAALDQMEVERKAAVDALAAARKEFGSAGGRSGGEEQTNTGGGGGERAPDAMVNGRPAWRVNGKWYDNPEGR